MRDRSVSHLKRLINYKKVTEEEPTKQSALLAESKCVSVCNGGRAVCSVHVDDVTGGAVNMRRCADVV